ncbi:hypothetical protein [Modicisalibacter radicis]|uniref:hypothetical protein n=1 Tax=Halomonas sp. EAR18 TaxID=2518972 RepID=UPI0014440191|nr:hypothetical protein [Halomonas sp. EAR18]
MRLMLQTVSLAMLVLTVLFPMLYLFDAMADATMKWSLLIVTVVWFLVTPLWMGRSQAP